MPRGIGFPDGSHYESRSLVGSFLAFFYLDLGQKYALFLPKMNMFPKYGRSLLRGTRNILVIIDLVRGNGRELLELRFVKVILRTHCTSHHDHHWAFVWSSHHI